MPADLELLSRHVERHNAGVLSGDFAPTLAQFTDDADLVFENIPVGPFHGVDAIARAYAERPPDDEIRVFDERVDGDDLVASYAWSRDPDTHAGDLRLTVRDGRIARITVSFV